MKINRFSSIISLFFTAATVICFAVATKAHSHQKEGAMISEQEFISLVTAGDVVKVKEALNAAPSLSRAADKDGVSAVLKAVYHNRKDVVEVLVSSRRDLDIFEASATGQTRRVEELISKDRSLVNAFAVDGFYPLGLAVFFKHADTVKLLLEAGADVNAQARNQMKVRPIHAASAAGEIEIARLLIERGADVNVRQQNEYTPLHEAALSGRIDFARLFLDHGAEINARAEDGKTALTIALEGGKEEMVKFLRARGATQ